MSAVNVRAEAIREVEEISEIGHFSQETLDLLRKRTDGATLLITGARGGTGSRGGVLNHLARLRAQQTLLSRIRFGLLHS